jgi:hypothetical protein
MHGLDLADALRHVADLPARAVAHTVDVLAQVAEPVEFIDAATGRSSTRVLPIL